jgi:heme-degrading monooxygenase HmoA
MYGSFTIFHVQPGKLDEVIGIWRDGVMPEVKHQKGLLGGKLYTDRNSGKCVIVSQWQTEADARAYQSDGEYQKQVAKLVGLCTAPPVREVLALSAEA